MKTSVSNCLTTSELRALWPLLSASERVLAKSLLENNGVWYPLLGPQLDAYLSEADETFYGGAAGGGKTDLVIGLALTAHRESIIFRREFPQLKGIVRRTKKILNKAKASYRYNGQDKVFYLDDERYLELGAVQYEDDWEKYQGRPHDLKVFDEICHFLKSQYRALIGWLRTDVEGQRCRVVVTGNPPTSPEGEWVKQYWGAWLDPKHPNPARPGELRWYAVLDGEDVEVSGPEPIEHDGELIQPRSRTFIPARVEDNPYYMNTGYKATLQALPEPLRSQMLKGDFSAGVDDHPWQVIPTAWVRLAQERWKAREQPDLPMTALGVDVARGGKDKTVLAPRYGNWFGPMEKHPGSTTPDGPAVAALVIKAIEGEEDVAVNVDVIGAGSGAYDSLGLLGVEANPVNVGAGATEGATDKSGKLKFVNKRAELTWKFREALDPDHGDDIALPDDPELLADLCALRWTLRINGIQVESKDDVKKRIGRSPDCGDAALLASDEGVSLFLFGI